MTAKYTRKHIDRCVESATYQTGSLKLDRDAGIVYGVKVLGWSGKNGTRVYKRPAVEKALPLYDGAAVNLNHAKVEPGDMRRPDHDVTKRFGRIINPRITGDGLYADLKYNRKHWYADTFTEWVDTDPGAIGLSHDAILQGPVNANGTRSIESIPRVFSVDLVADPGSTKGLHEDDSPEDDEGVMEGASQDMSDLENDDYGDAEEHLCSFIVSIIKDKSLSMDERKSKVLEAMKLLDDSGGDDGDVDDEKKPKDKSKDTPKPEKKDMADTKGTESVALTDAERLELDDLRREKHERAQESKARTLCTKAELDPKLVTDVFVGLMVRAQESAWEGLIADRKLQVGSSERPTSSPPTPGDKNGKNTRSLDDFEKFVCGETK